MIDEKERQRRIKQLKRQLRAELGNTQDDPERIGCRISELGALLADAALGRDLTISNGYHGTTRGTYTRSVRKALGYTYP